MISEVGSDWHEVYSAVQQTTKPSLMQPKTSYSSTPRFVLTGKGTYICCGWVVASWADTFAALTHKSWHSITKQNMDLESTV